MNVTDKFFLLLVLSYLDKSYKWVHIGRRKIQLELNRVCGAGVSKKLKSLVDGGYIVRNERRATVDSFRYRLNHLFAETEVGGQWCALSDVLFHPDNPWGKLRKRPSIGHGYLNPSGVLVLGAIIAAENSVSTGQLQVYLRGLVGEQTVKTCVRQLHSEEIVFRDENQLLGPFKDWKARLKKYEIGIGASQRHTKNFKTLAKERLIFNGYHFHLHEIEI